MAGFGFQLINLTWLFVILQCAKSSSISINIDTSKVLQVVGDKFVGVALDASLIKDGWINFDFSSRKLINLASALSPCYLRVGGTSADRLIFDPNKTRKNKPIVNYGEEYEPLYYRQLDNFTMSSTDWVNINKFTTLVKWDLIFDLNVLLRSNGYWDAANAETLLNFTAAHGFRVSGFQLGNEPNSFHHVFDETVDAGDLAADFYHLHSILHSSSHFDNSLIIGPDTTQVARTSAREYLAKFLSSGGGETVDKATFHHYYIDGRTATIDDFMDASILDSFQSQVTQAVNISRMYSGKPVWLGETSSAYGGGAPGLSDAFVAGFMWLDKLGVSAKYGLKGVIRQSFYKGHYSLLDEDNLDPLPDYWLTVLYKRLVGNAVFNTTTDSRQPVRVYAHCTNTNSMYDYSAGSVTLYAMNLLNRNVTISIPQFSQHTLHVYWLTPHMGNLKSRAVQLNGRVLEMVEDQLPPLPPLNTSSNMITLPRHSFGFIIIPDANIAFCQKTT